MANRKRSTVLLTQKDGRIYAMNVLARLGDDRRQRSDSHVICPFNPHGELGNVMEPLEYYRTEPQWDGFAKDVLYLFQTGTLEAQKGFLAILTDCFGGDGITNPNYYRELEKKGYLQDFGVRGDAMPLPVASGSWNEVERLTGWKPDVTAA